MSLAYYPILIFLFSQLLLLMVAMVVLVATDMSDLLHMVHHTNRQVKIFINKTFSQLLLIIFLFYCLAPASYAQPSSYDAPHRKYSTFKNLNCYYLN